MKSTCIVCGEEFYHPSRARLYCSNDCMQKFYVRRNHGLRNHYDIFRNMVNRFDNWDKLIAFCIRHFENDLEDMIDEYYHAMEERHSGKS